MDQLNFTTSEVNQKLADVIGDMYRSPVDASNTSVFSALLSWADSNVTARASTYTNILYYDPENGNDANNGARYSPKKNPPTSLSANTIYALKGGTTWVVPDRIDVAANSMVTSYDEHLGRAIIDGSVTATSTKDANAFYRVFRVGADNFTLANLDIIGPVGADNGGRAIIYTAVGGSNFKCLNNILRYKDQNGFFSRAIQLVDDAQFTIEGNYIYNCYNPIQISTIATPTSGTLSTLSRIRFNKIQNANLQTTTYFVDNGDSITMDGTQSYDWNWNLLISDNDISGFHENGFDGNRSSRYIFARNEVHHAATYSPPTACMAGSLTVPVGPTLFIGNYIHHIEGGAFGARNAQGMTIIGNIVDNCVQGVWLYAGTPTKTRVINNTFVNLRPASTTDAAAVDVFGIYLLTGSTDTEFFNNIVHVQQSNIADFGRYLNGLYNTTTNTRIGGNIFCGPLVFAPDGLYSSKHFIPDSYYPNISDVIDLVTYKPKIPALTHQQESLGFTALDNKLSPYHVRAVGALLSDTWKRA